MANHIGSEGKVFIGSNQVAEVIGFSFDETTDMIEDTILTDADKTFQIGKKGATGTIECQWDETDTLGQEAMVNGASVSLELKPEGDVSGDTKFTGTALINQISRANAIGSMVTATFSFTITGAMTKTTEL